LWLQLLQRKQLFGLPVAGGCVGVFKVKYLTDFVLGSRDFLMRLSHPDQRRSRQEGSQVGTIRPLERTMKDDNWRVSTNFRTPRISTAAKDKRFPFGRLAAIRAV
jgi:hypothetical protein